MKPPNWDRLQAIYHEALAKPESERDAFVERECAGDQELLQKIKSLLKNNDLLNDILKSPVFEINPASDDLVGTTIGERYLIERELGPGGMSHVYLALDQRLEPKRVVIKVLSPTLVQDPDARRRFDQEVAALLKVDHGGVVRVLDREYLPDGRPYIVMQYVEGETLRSQIPSQGMDLERAASVLKQIGAALDHVHQKGIFHRDLKPENVMLKAGTDSVVLIDFGIAKIQNVAGAATTATGIAAGTLAYMSPEQLRGENVTAASDIYSMAIVAYEMLCGERPSDLQRIGKLPPKVSTKAQHIIRRALSFDPKNRYRNAKEFGDKLAAALVAPKPSAIDLSVVAKALGGLFILALLSFGVYKYIFDRKVDRTPNRSFTYWLMVQRVRDGKDYQSPIKSNGEETFNNGDKFQLNVLTPITGYLYIMKESPPTTDDISFRMIFPNQTTNNGSASLGANQTIQSEWFTFQGPPGDENFWMVWSLTQVSELESAKLEAFKHPRGGLTDPTLATLKEFLRTKQLENKVTVYHYREEQKAVPRSRSDMLITLARFKHR